MSGNVRLIWTPFIAACVQPGGRKTAAKDTRGFPFAARAHAMPCAQKDTYEMGLRRDTCLYALLKACKNYLNNGSYLCENNDTVNMIASF